MAHKKAGGSTRNGRDSRSQRLGVKIFGDQYAVAGNIIVKQHGMSFNAGEGVGVADDNTLYALRDGLVKFQAKMVRKFTGHLQRTRFVSVVEPKAVTAAPSKKKSTAKSK